MKTKLLILLAAAAAAAVVWAEAPWITERSAMVFSWEHEHGYGVRIYTNGQPWRTFAPSEIARGESLTNGLSVWTALATAPKGGMDYRFTATAIDSNGVESDPSNVYPQYIRLGPPGNFGGRAK